jgi:protein-disulfide isomerase
MEQTSHSNRFLTWGIFIVLIVLVVWGLVAAQNKAKKEEAQLTLPSEITATDHTRGSTIAPVTLVEYGDFQCPACGLYHPIVEQLLKDEGPDAIRFVFRNFPLQQHGNAVPAAKAAEAAGVQGKYWEMYNLLYDRQDIWKDATEPKTVFVGYAKELGLDTQKFSTDFERQDFADKIDLDYKGGARAGINATPTFFINGQMAQTEASLAWFKDAIKNAATTATTTAK